MLIMPNASWKTVERKVAEMVGGARAGPMGQGQGDVIHPIFHIEVKAYQDARVPGLALWEKTKGLAARNGKEPLVVYHPKGSHKYMAVVDLDYLMDLVHLAGKNV